MPKVSSIDLRERVLQSLDEGLSKMAAHRTFRVSRSTIEHWLASRAGPLSFAGTCHSRLFELWLHVMLCPELRAGQVVISDNARFHRGRNIGVKFSDSGA